jgi:hypothetical protein
MLTLDKPEYGYLKGQDCANYDVIGTPQELYDNYTEYWIDPDSAGWEFVDHETIEKLEIWPPIYDTAEAIEFLVNQEIEHGRNLIAVYGGITEPDHWTIRIVSQPWNNNDKPLTIIRS